MRVLLVTYYFPPAGGGGVQRVLGWCRHLGEVADMQLTVLAPEAPRWVDEDTTLVIPGDVGLIRTSDPSPAAVIPADDISRARGPVSKLLRKAALQPRRFAVPDIHRRWRGPAVAAALRAAEANGGWDVVVSSSPPETTHWIAHDIARALDIPWCADFRDSWLDLPHLRMDSAAVRIKHTRNVRLATRLLRSAALATTVSEPLARDLRARHPGLDVHVVENGVETDEVERARSRAAGFREAGRFVVAYTGNFFGRQSPATFLDALEVACQQEPRFARDVQVRFIGGLKARDAQRIAASAELASVIECEGFLRHDDVLATQAAADLLFLYVAPGRGSQGVYTGKVFEYVAARRPVLALAPSDNVGVALLASAGSTDPHRAGAQVEPDDVNAIAVALLKSWRHWLGAGGSSGSRVADIAVPTDVLDRIDRRTLASRFAVLLRSIMRVDN